MRTRERGGKKGRRGGDEMRGKHVWGKRGKGREGVEKTSRIVAGSERFIRASTFVKLQIGAVHRCWLLACIFRQNFIHPHFYNLELLVRHRFCEFIRASVWPCAFT